jgi:hypothetical protein
MAIFAIEQAIHDQEKLEPKTKVEGNSTEVFYPIKRNKDG